MDRITKSILRDFQEDFDIKELSESDAFELLTGYLTTAEYCKEDISDLDFMTTGFSGGDLAIDALVILVNGEIINDVEQVKEILEKAKSNFGGEVSVKFIFTQSKTSSSFEASQILNFLNGVELFIGDEHLENISPEIKNKIEIRNLIYDNYTKLSGNPSVEMYYCTTGKWSDDNGIKSIINKGLKRVQGSDFVSGSQFYPIGKSRIQEMYRDTKRGIEQTINISYKVTLPEARGIDQAYFGFVPLSEYIKLITDSSGTLIDYIFHYNVRGFQGLENKTNQKIDQTLRSTENAQLFFALNNGVTVISRNLKPQGEKFTLYDYQIVNGCQTSHVLYNYFVDYKRSSEISGQENLPKLDSINVPIKIIHSSDESVISQIVSATNSQTAVNDDDLMARDKYHSVLENYFSSEEDENLKLFYERRSKQYAEFDIQKIRIISKKQLLRYFGAMFCQLPTEAARFSGKLYENVGEGIFNETHQPSAYHFAAYSSFKLEHYFRKNRSDSDNKMKPEYKTLRFHILMIIPFLIFDKNPPLNGRKSEKYFHQGISILGDDEKSLKIYQRAIEVIDDFLSSPDGKDYSLEDSELNKKTAFSQNLLTYIRRDVGYEGIVLI